MEQICLLFTGNWLHQAFCKNMGLEFSMALLLKGSYSSVLNQSQNYYDHVATKNNYTPFQDLILLQDSLSFLEAPPLIQKCGSFYRLIILENWINDPVK